MNERFGPMSQEIEVLGQLCDQLDEHSMRLITRAYTERGSDDAKYAWRAAREAGREQEVGSAAGAMSKAVEVNGFNQSPALVVMCGLAAFDAGIAMATRDLVGQSFYGKSDYDRLMYPWRAAFPEVA